MAKRVSYGPPSTKRFRSNVVRSSSRSSSSSRSRVPRPIKVNFGRQPVPNILKSRLKYSEIVSFTLNANGLAGFVFSANGLFDPNVTGTGHQPMYFDQMMALYDHYHVMNSTIKFTPLYTINVSSVWTAFTDDDANIGSTSPYAAIEKMGSVTTTESLTQQPAKPLFQSFDAKKVFGGDPLSQSSLQGTASSNPSEQSYYFIYCNAGVDGGSSSVNVLVELWYDVVFDEVASVDIS